MHTNMLWIILCIKDTMRPGKMIVMVAATVADIFSAHPTTDITDVTDITDTLSWIILGPESYSASPGRSSTWTLCPADFRVTIST